MTAFSNWLHSRPLPQLIALRAFRRMASEAYPDAPNPVEAALAAGNVPPVIAAMPREFVLATNH